MTTMNRPDPNFRQEDVMVTCVVAVPAKKVSYLHILIDNYATAPTLPPELITLLKDFQRQMPPK